MIQSSHNPLVGYFWCGAFFVLGALLVLFPAPVKSIYDRWPVGLFGRPVRAAKIWHFRALGLAWMIFAIMGMATIYNVTH